MFLDMAAKYDVHLHVRHVARSSLSFVMPKGGKRAIVRCRDDHYLEPYPTLDLQGCRALHIDRRHNGMDLLGDTLYVEQPERSLSFGVVKRPRIGVDYAGHWARRLLRFYIKANPYVSKP